MVAGFTGRDALTVERHVEELVAIGMEPPPEIPAFFALPNWLLQVGLARIEVASSTTSGEAEPVLIQLPTGDRFVAVGSDQTDRHLELDSIRMSKLACPKVISDSVWPYESVAERWDTLLLRSFAGNARVPYQEATLAEIRRPLDLLERAIELRPLNGRALVLLLGTVPLMASTFIYSDRFIAELHDPHSGRALRCGYDISVTPDPAQDERATTA
jgi:hypothetical protein